MKKINFVPSTEKSKHVIAPPVPSSRKIPEWFKNIKTNILDNSFTRMPSGGTNLTVKACPAVIDLMTTGYMITLDADISFVDPNQFGYRVMWDVSWPVVSEHFEDQIPKQMVPEGFERTPFKWERSFSWSIQSPPGYSLLYLHPFYRYDLPFLTVPGIVDSDLHDIPINIPFFIKKDFFGVIEKGTPIAQIIPIKRESWSHNISEELLKNYDHKLDILKSTIYRSYKKNVWKKKSYK